MRRASIQRISLAIPGLTAGAGAELGRRVAERLAAANLEPAQRTQIPNLRLTLASRPGEPPESIAERIAAEIIRGIERS